MFYCANKIFEIKNSLFGQDVLQMHSDEYVPTCYVYSSISKFVLSLSQLSITT